MKEPSVNRYSLIANLWLVLGRDHFYNFVSFGGPSRPYLGPLGPPDVHQLVQEGCSL